MDLSRKSSSMLDKIDSKIVHKDEKALINRGKRSKTMIEVKPVENISKNPQSFRDKSYAKGSLSFT